MKKVFQVFTGLAVLAILVLMATTASSKVFWRNFTIHPFLPGHSSASVLEAGSRVMLPAAPAETSDTISVSADTYIYQGGTSTNNGAATSLTVKCVAASSTYNRLTLLKFDLGTIDTSKGRITRAVLQLHISGTDAIASSTKKTNMDETPYIVGYLRDNSWQENTVTWNNYADIALGYTSVATQYGSSIPFTGSSYPLTLTPNASLTWDIGDIVAKGKLKEAPLSLTVYSSTPAANMGAFFYSKEYAGEGHDTLQPRLIIVQDPAQYFLQAEDTIPTVFDSIMQNVRTVLYNGAPAVSSLDASVTGYQNTIGSNGAWLDINYTNTAQTDWAPLAHLDRVKAMALAYTTANSSFYQNAILYQHIVNAMQYWYDANPVSTNWYNQEIASPQRVGQILILMRSGLLQVPTALELRLLGRMASMGGAPDQSGSQGTGANKLNIAMHWIYRGCLSEDTTVLSKGVSQAYYPLFLTSGEGIQYDYSYKQHGMQLYIGGYGWDLINGESSVALYTVGTSYALAGDQLDILSKYTRETYLRVIRGHNFLYNVLGRGLSRSGGLGQSGFTTQLNQMKQIDATNAAEYDQAIARLKDVQPAGYGIAPVHAHYFNSDYTLQIRPSYSFDVRMVSSRTARNENGNGENLRGYFLSDGATDIGVDGMEYFNIFPVWDWSMIPGVTSRHMATGSIPVPAQWGTNGNTAFVGGVSDSLYGLSVYDLNNNNTAAKKSWFFFDDEIVCLGAGIQSSGAEEVNTTVNQCLLDGQVSVSSGGVVSNYTGNTTALDFDNNLDWVLHGNVGYVFPQGGEVGLKMASQSGNWYTINTSGTNATVSKDVFSLWLKHGVQPTGDKYAYIVLPGKTSATEMQSYTSANNIVIARNDDTVQSVYHRGLQLWQMAFYKSLSAFQNDSIGVSTNAPCLLMLQQLPDHKVMVHVSDPSQSLTSVTVNIKWPGISSTKQQEVQLPEAPYLGKSAVFVLSDTTPDYIPPPVVIADTLTPLDDAYVRSGTYGATNYGTVELQVKDEGNGNYSRQSFLKFDLNQLSSGKGDIESVKLLLTVQSSGTGVATNPFYTNYVSDNSWSENTINWNNKPAATEQLTSVPGKTSGTLSWDITGKVLDLIADNNKTMSLQVAAIAPDVDNNSEGWCNFYSKETAGNPLLAPQLVVIYKDAAMPLDIVDFKARQTGNNVLLHWHTAQENNTAYIQVLRGANANTLDVISTLAAQGFKTGTTAYQYTDQKALTGLNYYQLNIVDKDGKAVKSDVIHINMSPSLSVDNDLKIAPNPAKSFIKVTAKETGKMQILNYTGVVVLEQMIQGGTATTIDIHKLTPGVYFVKQKAGVQKIIIMH